MLIACLFFTISSVQRNDVITIVEENASNVSPPITYMSTTDATLRQQCEYCMKTFQSVSEYNVHMDVVEHDGKYRCRWCGSAHETKEARNEHIKQHLGSFVKICDVCGKGFKSRFGYRTHYLMYHSAEGQNLPRCKTCGKVFPTTNRLMIHERVHSDERSFVCNVCFRSFKHNSNLQKHACRPSPDWN